MIQPASPAPWTLGVPFVFGTDAPRSAAAIISARRESDEPNTVVGFVWFPGEPKGLANACLICAAPEMLAALEMTVELSQHAGGCRWFNVPLKEMEDEAGRASADAKCDCHLKAAKDAITKAKGGAR